MDTAKSKYSRGRERDISLYLFSDVLPRGEGSSACMKCRVCMYIVRHRPEIPPALPDESENFTRRVARARSRTGMV